MDRSATTVGSLNEAAETADRPPFRTTLGLTRYLTVGGLAGLIAGVAVGGVGARLFMRIAGAAAGGRARGATTEAGFTVGEITLGGSLGLVVFVGILAGIVGAAFYLVFRPWLSWAGPWRGVAFGIILFALASATSDVLNPDNVDFAILGNEVLVIAMVVALFVGFGALIDPAFGWLDRRLPEADRSHRLASGAYVVFAPLGILLGTAFLAQAMFTRNLCDCDPPTVASLFLAVTAAGTLGWIASAFSTSAGLRAVSRFLGLVGLVGASAAGLVRAIGDAAEILRG
jgi:ABC-type transport system involved in cytochrome c biogenesis permease subunit